MKDVSEQNGRTVLFVSHNMTAVNSLCSRCMLLKNGTIDYTGEVEEVTAHYLKHVLQSGSEKEWQNSNVKGDGVIQPISMRIMDLSLQTIPFIQINKTTGIEFIYEIIKTGWKPIPNFHIFTASGETAFISIEPHSAQQSQPGVYKTIMWVPENFLNDGFYTIGIAVSTLNPTVVHFCDYEALSIEVIDNLGSVTRSGYTGKIKGAVRPSMNWETKKIT